MSHHLPSSPSPSFEATVHPSDRPHRTRRPRSGQLPGILLALALSMIAGLASAVQEDRRHKVPVMDKITSGSSRQAFSGRVQSVDLKRKLLNINTVQGSNTEIFPVTKGVRVETAGGEKLKLKSLAPGTTVIVYYDQRGDQRTVKEIIRLAAGS